MWQNRYHLLSSNYKGIYPHLVIQYHTLPMICLWSADTMLISTYLTAIYMCFDKCLCLSHIKPRVPYDFWHPYDFLPVKPSEAPVGILRRCCSHGHWILMVWLNKSQDSTRAMPVRTSCGSHTGVFNAFHSQRDPYGARAWPAMVTYGALTDT